MGTITPRTSADGKVSYKAQVRIKREGVVLHQETQTFARETAARAWVKKREVELAKPGALQQISIGDPPLSEVINRYLTESRIPVQRDKRSALTMLRDCPLGQLRCSAITSHVIYKFAETLTVAPSTVNGYFAYLTTVFKVARLVWGYPLDVATINEARFAMRHMGLTAQSKRRDRRPTLDEMNRIVEYLRRRNLWHKGAMPMEYVTLFAIFSTRRLGEIARLERDHVDARRGKILVYDMKDPKKKLGNNVWVDVSAEAIRVLQAVPTTGARFFPYTVSAMSDAFKEARVECGVEELTFHDLRHEGVSRLFEMGHSIPEVSAMSGHKSWANLRRYTHLEQCGDKYAGWQWLDVIAPLPQRPLQTKPQS